MTNELQEAMALKIQEMETKKSAKLEKMKELNTIRKRQKTDSEKAQINNDKSNKRLERFEAKREKKAEKLRNREQKLRDREEKYLQKEKSKEISDRLKQIDQSEQTIEKIKKQIITVSTRTTRRTKTISLIEKDIAHKNESLINKKIKAQQHIENLKKLPDTLKSKLQNDVARLIEYRDRLQSKVDEKLDKIKSLNEIDYQDKIKTREEFIKNLESGIANTQNYINKLYEKQERDQNKLLKLDTELSNTIKRFENMKTTV